jgi:hypothetical protein
VHAVRAPAEATTEQLSVIRVKTALLMQLYGTRSNAHR